MRLRRTRDAPRCTGHGAALRWQRCNSGRTLRVERRQRGASRSASCCRRCPFSALAALLVVIGLGPIPHKSDAAKDKVLHDGPLARAFGAPHLQHAGGHLGKVGHGERDVGEDGRMLVERPTLQSVDTQHGAGEEIGKGRRGALLQQSARRAVGRGRDGRNGCWKVAVLVWSASSATGERAKMLKSSLRSCAAPMTYGTKW